MYWFAKSPCLAFRHWRAILDTHRIEGCQKPKISSISSVFFFFFFFEGFFSCESTPRLRVTSAGLKSGKIDGLPEACWIGSRTTCTIESFVVASAVEGASRCKDKASVFNKTLAGVSSDGGEGARCTTSPRSSAIFLSGMIICGCGTVISTAESFRELLPRLPARCIIFWASWGSNICSVRKHAV